MELIYKIIHIVIKIIEIIILLIILFFIISFLFFLYNNRCHFSIKKLLKRNTKKKIRGQNRW
jgi:hypothetical protein